MCLSRSGMFQLLIIVGVVYIGSGHSSNRGLWLTVESTVCQPLQRNLVHLMWKLLKMNSVNTNFCSKQTNFWKLFGLL